MQRPPSPGNSILATLLTFGFHSADIAAPAK